MLNRILLKSRTLLVLAGAGLVLAVAVFASINGWRPFTRDDFPGDMFPDDLAGPLKDEIARGRQRILRSPTAGSWGSLGEICVAHGLLPQAEFCFQRASTLAPDDPKWIYQLAVMAEKVDFVRAIALFDKVLSLDRSVEAVHYRRGLALARIGRFEDAEQSLKTAGKLSQQHPLVLKAIAQLRLMQNDDEGALVLIREAVSDSRAGLDIVEEAKRLLMRQSPPDLTAASSLAEANASRPQVTPPLPDPWMEGVARRLPHTTEVGAKAGELASQQQYKAALEMYERLMRMQNRNSRAHTAHAMVLMNAGRVQQALEEMKKVCEEFPHDPLAFSSRGTIEFHLKDFSAALTSFEEAVRLKPDFVDAHRALLLIFQIEKMTDRVDVQFRTLLALVPNDQELREQYEVFQRDRGERLEPE
jgi:Flp pilus assembly protein TadD